jgi:hypothetical protein
MSDRDPHPVAWLRELALSLERLAAQGVASGAVRGAAEELKAGVPEAEAQVRTLIPLVFRLLERLAEEGARPGASPIGAWSRSAAVGATQGAVEEFRRLVPEMRPMNQELFRRARLWLERTEEEAAARVRAIRDPGDLARVAAAGAIQGATEQLRSTLPALAEPASDVAAAIGRGVVRGAAEEVSLQARRAARSPVLRAVLAGGAALAIVAVSVARRR